MLSDKRIQYAIAGVLIIALLTGLQGAFEGLPLKADSPPTPTPTLMLPPTQKPGGGPSVQRKGPTIPDPAQAAPGPFQAADVGAMAVTSWVPVSQDTPMYEGQPNTSLADDDAMWVGYYSGSPWLRERGLVQWNMYWLPENITISHAGTYLWLLDYTGPDSCEIATHRVTNDWGEATWNSRYSGVAWSIPGGDFDATPLATGTVYTNTDEWVWMGDITSLVQGWHSSSLPNYGVLYKGTNESGSDSDRLFALSEYSSWQDPALYVDYTFNGSIEQLPANDPQTKGTPSGDHYFSHTSLSDWKWRAYGIRPPSGADYDLCLYDNPDFYIDFPPSVDGKSSWWSSDAVDLVVIGRNAPQEVRYARVMDWSGSGNYQVEFATTLASLSGSGTFGPYSIGSNSVLKMFEFSGIPGQNYSFTLQIASGDADLGMMLCDPSVLYAGRGGCSAYADDQGAGGTEQMEYQIGNTTDWHGLVVWNNGASTSSQFYIQVEPVVSLSYVYLPSVLRAYFVDPYEPNDRPSEADEHSPLANGVSYYAYAYDENDDYDDDYYWFNLDTQTTVTVRVTNFSATQGQLIVLDADLKEIAKDTNQGHPSTMQLKINQLSPGKYYVRVYAQGELNTQTLYELKVTW